jgi:malonate transporter and related proteins
LTNASPDHPAMLDILAVTAPIYLLIALGFMAVRLELMSLSDMRVLGRFVLYFAIPAMLFRMMSRLSSNDIANVDLFTAYVLASFVIFGLVMAIACLLQRQSVQIAAILAGGASIGNSGVIGYQVVEQSLGTQALPIIAIAIVVENIILALVIALAETGERDGRPLGVALKTAFARLVRSPLVVSIVLGGLTAASGLALPRPFARALDILAAANGAVALFTIGGTLVGVKVRGVIRDVGLVVVSKLALHPVLVFAALLLYPAIDPRLQAAAVVAASVPVFSIFPIIGQKFGMEKFGAAAVLTATVISFVSVSAVLALVRTSGWFGPLP